MFVVKNSTNITKTKVTTSHSKMTRRKAPLYVNGTLGPGTIIRTFYTTQRISLIRPKQVSSYDPFLAPGRTTEDDQPNISAVSL
jgi:hypothetical protein